MLKVPPAQAIRIRSTREIERLATLWSGQAGGHEAEDHGGGCLLIAAHRRNSLQDQAISDNRGKKERKKASGGPDGGRIREFHTSGVASITQQPLPFSAYFPLIDPHPSNPSYPRRRPQRLQAEVWPEVRRRTQTESLRHLAAAYGVSHETIRRILRTERVSAEPVPSRSVCAERS